jgi:cyclase
LNESTKRRIAAVLLAAVLTTAARAQQAPTASVAAPDPAVQTVNVAPGIYMLTGRGGNVGVSVGVDGVAIIDDKFADNAPNIRAAVALLSPKPVGFVINTHLHGDHTGGNEAFGIAGAVIIAQENVRKRLSVDVVNPSNGQTIPARPRAALPVVTFEDTAALHFNDDDLEFTHLPNAHTETDIVVRFRKANVVHMGDCFTAGFPFIDGNNGGTLDGLIRGQEKVLPTIDDKTILIRGHGPNGDKAGLQAYHDMLVAVRDRIAKLVKSGKSQEDVVAARPTKDYEEKYGGGGFNEADWIGRAYVDQKTAAARRKKK